MKKGALWIFNAVISTSRFGRPLAVSVLVHHWKLSRVLVSFNSRPLLCLASLVIFTLCSAANAAEDIDTILDKQEADIKTLAAFVVQNYRDSSDLAEGCAVNCSRRNCQPLTTDNFVCGYVPDNPDCRQKDKSSCKSTMLDWSQSFVVGSPDANLENESPNCDMRKTICAQKQLDTQFFTKEERSTDLVAGVTWFGASNGISRAYPGKDWNYTACSTYDLRVRPWYVAATALAKDIVVLLDSGLSSGEALALESPGVTVFAALKNITSRMLMTLTYEDSISVFTLANAAQLVGMKTSVPNGGSINVNPSVFETLNTQIQGLGDPGNESNIGKANLTVGLKVALAQFDEMSSLKIVIFLTTAGTTGDLSGEYLDESLVEELIKNEVTVFIFRVLSTASPGGNDGVTNLLQNTTCVINGGYAEQLYDRQDPYMILQPFYSYVARLRYNQNGQKPFWVTKFDGYSAQGQVVAVAMPVFDGDLLIGVACRNIFVDYLQNVTSNLNQVLNMRNSVGTLQLNNRSISTLCGQVGLPDQSCPGILSGISPVTGFCTNIDTSSTLLERLCCRDSCPWPFQGNGGHDKDEVLKIAVPVLLIVATACFLLSTICVGWWLKTRKKNRKIVIPRTNVHTLEGSSRDMFSQPV